MTFIGVDIGATSIKAALVGPGPTLLARGTRPTEAQHSLDASLAQLHALIGELHAQLDGELRGIGVGVPGAIDQERGIVYAPPNMPAWKEVALARALGDTWHCPVRIDNDANCAALGEAYFGAGRGETHFLGLTLGTGVGAGIIVERRIFHGMRGFAGEFGHLTIDMNGPRCGCGNRGCVEAFVGIQHLMREALPRLLEAGDSLLHERARNAPATLTPRDLSLAAEAGDPVAAAVLRLAGERLGVAIASAANLLDITVFIVGGGIAKAGAPLFNGMRDAARERVLAVHRDALRILPAEHGNDAGMLGAAALFLD